MFANLEDINRRPEPYEFNTVASLWNDEHISEKMLELHLNESVDLASRNKGFIDRSVDFIASKFDVGAETKICDFGCGPGLYTTQFAEKGARVTGIDFSSRSIAYARNSAAQKNLNIEYILQDYLQFSANRKFNVITLIYLDFCPLSPRQRKILLSIFYDCLESDGAIIIDVLSENYFDKVHEKRTYEYSPENGFWSSRPYYAFLNTFTYEKHKVVLDKHTIIEENASRTIFNWLQCYSLESLKKEFRESGFSISEYYNDVAGTPYRTDSTEIAVIAQKILGKNLF